MSECTPLHTGYLFMVSRSHDSSSFLLSSWFLLFLWCTAVWWTEAIFSYTSVAESSGTKLCCIKHFCFCTFQSVLCGFCAWKSNSGLWAVGISARKSLGLGRCSFSQAWTKVLEFAKFCNLLHCPQANSCFWQTIWPVSASPRVLTIFDCSRHLHNQQSRTDLSTFMSVADVAEVPKTKCSIDSIGNLGLCIVRAGPYRKSLS